jgi:hypothetical protein
MIEMAAFEDCWIKIDVELIGQVVRTNHPQTGIDLQIMLMNNDLALY